MLHDLIQFLCSVTNKISACKQNFQVMCHGCFVLIFVESMITPNFTIVGKTESLGYAVTDFEHQYDFAVSICPSRPAPR